MASKFKFQTFEKNAQINLDALSGQEAQAELALFAITERMKAINNGEASSIYDTYVNGVEGKDTEHLVRVPGPIFYVFSYWREVIDFALAALEKKSPMRRGKYKASHVVMVGSQIMRRDAEIAADEEVTIVNTQPYSRKIEVGHMKMRVPGTDAVFKQVRAQVNRRFGGAEGPFDIRMRMIYIPNNYVLKGHFTRGHKPKARTKLQRDTAAGQRVTYPALVMSVK